MQSLGGYTFYWNPDKMSIPEKRKTVSRVVTYGGSAIFEWEALLQGTKVDLEWDFMPKAMYTALRELYLQVGEEFVWDPETGGNTYNIRIVALTGEYFGTVLHEGPWRRNVKLTLDIRSFEAKLQSTTTTTTTE